MTNDTLPGNVFMSDPIYKRLEGGGVAAWGFIVDRGGKRWCTMKGTRKGGPESVEQSDWVACESQEEALAAANGMRVYLMREEGYKALLSEVEGISPVPSP